MFRDVKTVVWKEYRELFKGKKTQKQLLGKLFAPAILAAVFPITWGPEWVNEIPALVIAFILPAVLVCATVPDAFAGERERHTFDTLLASRLPDKAILIGKIIAPILVGWSSALLFTFVSLVVVNLAHYSGELLFYSPMILFGILSLSLISATLMTNGGILISLGSEGVQAAAQKLMTFVMVPVMLLQLVPMLFKDQFLELIQVVDGKQIFVGLFVILVLADVVLYLLASKKFQRSKLYLG